MKRIAVFCDGTWNRPDQEDGGVPSPTNVVKLHQAVLSRSADGTEQVTEYLKGVGTGPGLDRLLGGALGEGLAENVRRAYAAVVARYEPGDELFFFGFSRGAYTARSLAGMVRNAGVLRRDRAHMVPEADALYRRRDPGSHPAAVQAQRFRRENSHETRIRFVGVWDTVGSLGIPGALSFIARKRYAFHDHKLSSWVDNAFHAVAVDERRKPFAPTMWIAPPAANQRVEQTWFAGVHSNVGGGYRDACLSDRALLWMADRAAECGLAVDPSRLPDRDAPHCAGVLRDSMTPRYRPFGTYLRPIGGPGPECWECLDESLLRRMEEDESYRPPNVPATAVGRVVTSGR
jgi:uncharacterized protein (DUF2235 family)